MGRYNETGWKSIDGFNINPNKSDSFYLPDGSFGLKKESSEKSQKSIFIGVGFLLPFLTMRECNLHFLGESTWKVLVFMI